MSNFLNIPAVVTVVPIWIKKLHPDAVIPKYEHLTDSGADLVSVEKLLITPGQRATVATGIAIAIPSGYELQVRPRSGMALKQGVTVLNTPGTVDAGYRGEIKVILINHGTYTIHIEKGDRIAQAVIAPVYRALFTEVEELPDSDRGAGGFGSTGLDSK